MNRRLADPVAGVKAAQGEQTHASRTELGPLGTPDRRFSELVPDLPPPARPDDPPRPVLQTHDAAQRYGSLDAGLNLPEGVSAADNMTNSPLALVSHGGFSRAFLGVFPQKLPDGSAEFNSWFRIPLGSLASKRLDDPRAVDSYPIPGMTVESLVFVKNRRGQGLQQAVAELPPTQDGTRAFLRAVIDGDPADPAGGRLIDGDLLQPDWTGLIVLARGSRPYWLGSMALSPSSSPSQCNTWRSREGRRCLAAIPDPLRDLSLHRRGPRVARIYHGGGGERRGLGLECPGHPVPRP